MAWVLAGEQNSCYTKVMKNKPITNTHTNNNQAQAAKQYRQIKLGIDVHADSYRVVRQLDSASPQPAQKFTPTEFLRFAHKQLAQAQEVHSCYEAGPFGYVLHRELLKMGIANVVVRPQNWDELGRGVKTDRTDALALVQRLDRYVQGNQKALAVVRVPTPEQEQARAQTRHREQLQKDRQTHEAQGRSLLLFQGYRITGPWWKEGCWEKLKQRLPQWLIEILENFRRLIVHTDQLLDKATSKSRLKPKASPRVLAGSPTRYCTRKCWTGIGSTTGVKLPV
jgi:transposase